MWQAWSLILMLSFVITIVSATGIVTKSAVELQCNGNDHFTSYSSYYCKLSPYRDNSIFLSKCDEIIIRAINGRDPQANSFNEVEEVEISSEFSIELNTIPTQLFKIFPNLSTFNSKHTKISKILQNDFVNAHELSELDLSNNKIKQLDERIFATASNLTEIRIDFNAIHTVADYAFDGLTKLEEISMYRNKLQKIRKLSFSSLPSLQKLDISMNEISEIEDGAFNLPQLESLQLRGNKLTVLSDTLFAQLPALNDLDLSENQIQLVNNALYSLSALLILKLDRNKMQDFDLRKIAKLPELRLLDLSETDYALNALEISSTDINSSKSKLLFLYFNNNHRTGEVIFTKLKIFPELLNLHLENNLLKRVDFENIRTGGFSNLMNIYLKKNRVDCEWLKKNTRRSKTDVCQIENLSIHGVKCCKK